jgi:hypothetical protein
MKNLISYENFGQDSSAGMNEAWAPDPKKPFDSKKPFALSPTDPYEYYYDAAKKHWYTRNRTDMNPMWRDMKKTLGQSKFNLAYENIQKAIKDGKAFNISGGQPIASQYATMAKKIAAELKTLKIFVKEDLWRGSPQILPMLPMDSGVFTITPLGYYMEDESKWKTSPSEGLLTLMFSQTGRKESEKKDLLKKYAISKDDILIVDGVDEAYLIIKVNSKTTPILPKLIAAYKPYLETDEWGTENLY